MPTTSLQRYGKMSDLDRLIADIDALVDWQMTESPAAKVEHGPGSMNLSTNYMRIRACGPLVSTIDVTVPFDENGYVRQDLGFQVLGALREDDDGAGVLREDDPPGRAL